MKVGLPLVLTQQEDRITIYPANFALNVKIPMRVGSILELLRMGMITVGMKATKKHQRLIVHRYWVPRTHTMPRLGTDLVMGCSAGSPETDIETR